MQTTAGADSWSHDLVKNTNGWRINMHKCYQLIISSYDPNWFGLICNQWVDRVW